MSVQNNIDVPDDEIDPRYPTGESPEHRASRLTRVKELQDRHLGHLERLSLEIGGKTPQGYEAELQNEGYHISEHAKYLLAKVTTAKERQTLDLVRLKVSDLGFKDMTRYDQICARAEELDLERCPAEVGPALRLVMKDQPMGDWVIVAMELLTHRDGYPRVFRIHRDEGGSWLYTRNGHPGDQWYPGDSFVFARRKH